MDSWVTDEALDRELAEPFGRANLRPASEYLDGLRDFQNEGRRRAIPWGIRLLDDQLGHLYATDLALIVGDTGAGKTTAARFVVTEALRAGKRVAMFALEAHDGEIQQRMVFDEVRRLAWEIGVEGRQSLTFGRWANGLCSDAIHGLDAAAVHTVHAQCANLLMRYRGERFDVRHMRREFRAIGDEVDLLALDHVHYVDHDDGQGENAGLTEVSQSLRDVALDIRRPVLGVAHVRKRGAGNKSAPPLPTIEDIHGSSNLPKVTTRVISMAPALDRDDGGPRVALTYMRVSKDRWDGAKGLAGLLRFDLDRGRYEDEYVLGRFESGGQFEELTRDELPWWCSCEDAHRLPTLGADLL